MSIQLKTGLEFWDLDQVKATIETMKTRFALGNWWLGGVIRRLAKIAHAWSRYLGARSVVLI